MASPFLTAFRFMESSTTDRPVTSTKPNYKASGALRRARAEAVCLPKPPNCLPAGWCVMGTKGLMDPAKHDGSVPSATGSVDNWVFLKPNGKSCPLSVLRDWEVPGGCERRSWIDGRLILSVLIGSLAGGRHISGEAELKFPHQDRDFSPRISIDCSDTPCADRSNDPCRQWHIRVLEMSPA